MMPEICSAPSIIKHCGLEWKCHSPEIEGFKAIPLHCKQQDIPFIIIAQILVTETAVPFIQ